MGEKYIMELSSISSTESLESDYRPPVAKEMREITKEPVVSGSSSGMRLKK